MEQGVVSSKVKVGQMLFNDAGLGEGLLYSDPKMRDSDKIRQT